MSHPELFKTVSDCEKYFEGKGAGIFAGSDEVRVRILDDNNGTEEVTIYSITEKGLILKESNSTVTPTTEEIPVVEESIPEPTVDETPEELVE